MAGPQGWEPIVDPLIHTHPKFNLAQDMVSCQRGEKEAPTDQSSTQGQWGPPLKGHQYSELRNPSQILTLGGKYVIVTKGARGVSIYHEGGEINIPASEVKAVDPTGAGDVFSATLIKYMLEGKVIEEASIYASAASAISIQKVGVQTHPPSVEEIEDLVVKRGAG